MTAIERVYRLSHAEMARDLEVTLAQARAGAPLVQAMQSMSERTSLEPLSRFADGLITAIERATPLADVLRAQDGDVRESRKRALLETGGRREIAMMVPMVRGIRFRGGVQPDTGKVPGEPMRVQPSAPRV